MADQDAIRAALLRHAVSNAIKYGGKANPNAVAGMAFAEDPSLRENAKEVFRIAACDILLYKSAVDARLQHSLREERRKSPWKFPAGLLQQGRRLP